MRFSVIVPVYNIEKYVERCILSLITQEYKDCEFLIIVDGATDRSYEICKRLAKKDNRIKVYYKENGGLVSARKFGVKKANGEYIINVDGDDYVEKDYLVSVDILLKKFNPDVLALGYNEIQKTCIKSYTNNYKDGFYIGNDLENIKKNFLYDDSNYKVKGGSLVASIWTKIVKKNIYKECQLLVPDNISIGEDTIINSFILNKVKSLYILNQSYYNYVIYQSSMIHKCNVKNMKNYLEAAKQLKRIEYNNKDFINFYLLQGMISELRKYAKNVTSYKEFLKLIEMTPEYKQILNYAIKTKIFNKDLETGIKVILLKLRNLHILYFICKNI